MTQTLALAMTSCPRPEPYVTSALVSLRDAGFHEPLHVFNEPDSHDVAAFPNVVTHDNPTQLGCFPNWKNALTWMVENAAWDWVLMLQDDVVWRNDSARQMHQAINAPALQQVGFISPYTSKAMIPKVPNPSGWVDAKFHNKAFWGALAICMPRSSAQSLLAFQRFRDHKHHRKLDVIVGNCFRDMDQAIKVHVPSLADHIGHISTLGRHKIKGNAWGRKGAGFRPRV